MSASEVRNDLNEMVALLEDDDWENWAEFFRRALQKFDDGDLVACGKQILSGSGGMGSLNDVVLGQSTDEFGKFSWKPGSQRANERYYELLSRLYGFADQVTRQN